MALFSFYSDKLLEIIKEDESKVVFVDVEISSQRIVEYDTPFGPSFRWENTLDSINDIFFNKMIGDSYKKILTDVSCLNYYNLNKGFKEEVDSEIRKFISRL